MNSEFVNTGPEWPEKGLELKWSRAHDVGRTTSQFPYLPFRRYISPAVTFSLIKSITHRQLTFITSFIMTRTERASYPRAVLRDRSLSRSGLNTQLRKGGAGRHNWGGLEDESQLESQAMHDEAKELESLSEDEIPNATAMSEGANLTCGNFRIDQLQA